MTSMAADYRPRTDLPPGPSLPPYAQVFAMGFRTTKFLMRCYRRYGATFKLRLPGYDPQIVVTDPEVVREVMTGTAKDLHAGEANRILGPLVGENSLLLLEEKRHLHHRRLMLPPFHGERMHAYGETMQAIAAEEFSTWKKGPAFVAHTGFQRITLKVIVKTIFGVDSDNVARELEEAITSVMRAAKNPIWLLPAVQVNLGPLTAWAEIERAVMTIDRILYREIAERRAEPGDRDDILTMLVKARDEDDRPMSDEELRDEMVTLLFAGHETTTTSMAWAVYRVLSDKAVYEKVLDELARVTGGGPLDVNAVPKLEYLDGVIKESLRRDPVIPMIGRRLKKPMTIGGWSLPEGAYVAPSIYVTHHRDDVWPNANAFMPERFVGKRLDPYRWFPFGGGIRRCIGMAFALYEMRVVLAELFHSKRLRLEPGYEARAVRRSVTLAPSGGVRIEVE